MGIERGKLGRGENVYNAVEGGNTGHLEREERTQRGGEKERRLALRYSTLRCVCVYILRQPKPHLLVAYKLKAWAFWEDGLVGFGSIGCVV